MRQIYLICDRKSLYTAFHFSVHLGTKPQICMTGRSSDEYRKRGQGTRCPLVTCDTFTGYINPCISIINPIYYYVHQRNKYVTEVYAEINVP